MAGGGVAFHLGEIELRARGPSGRSVQRAAGYPSPEVRRGPAGGGICVSCNFGGGTAGLDDIPGLQRRRESSGATT